MKKLKCAVGYNGRFVFLERFPNDEEHAGLDEMLDFLADETYTVEEKAGVYMAGLVIEGEGESAVLEIETLERIK